MKVTSMAQVEPAPPARLRLHLAAAASAAVRAGHPWVYSDGVREQNRPGQLGDMAALYDRHDRFLALGLFDPNSPLRVRVLHTGKPVPINPEWWRGRLRAALARREGLFDPNTTGYRVIHGESDGWPGLVLDRYDATLVVKLYTAAWLPHWPFVAAMLQEELTPERIVLRLSRNILELVQGTFHLIDGQVICGPPPISPVVFLENGLRFEADVMRGQKTGFFLDQRENRRRVQELSAGRAVLNLFSFSGGFSVYAARGGARSVTDVDISVHALESAQRNFALNRAAVGGCHHFPVQADVFEWLRANRRPEFDLVILDPPSLARRDAERGKALDAYRALVRSAVQQLRDPGVLLAASCSAHVAAPEFFDAVRRTAAQAGRQFVELGTTFHPPDHPATFAEAQYLKAIYLQSSRS